MAGEGRRYRIRNRDHKTFRIHLRMRHGCQDDAALPDHCHRGRAVKFMVLVFFALGQAIHQGPCSE